MIEVSTTAVIYCRVSTAQQAREGISLDAQEEECREHAARLGLKVLAVHKDEGLSGKKSATERPGLAAVIRDVQAHGGTPAVVVYSLSRLGRSQRMIWNLLDERGEYRLRVSSVSEAFDTTSAMGRAFLGMLSTFAQLESDLASERTADALQFAKGRGKQLGALSMVESLDEEGKRFTDPAKVAEIKRIQTLHREKGLALRPFCDWLAEQGIKGSKGGRWQPRTLRAALAYRFI